MTQEYIQPPLSPNQHRSQEGTISLMDILLVLAQHFKLIIITPTIFCIVTIIYLLFFAEPVYVSTATFISFGSEGDNQSEMMGLATQFGFSMPITSSRPHWSYEEVIKSRTMAKTLLKHRFDTEKYGPKKELLQILTFGNEEPEVGIDTLIIESIKSLADMIEITKTKTLYALKVSAFEPQLASDMAFAVMSELDRHQQEYNTRNTTKTRQFIEARLIDTKAELEAAEEALKDFRERNRSILESPQLQLEQERLTRDVAVIISVFTILKQKLETAKIDEVKESDYVVILDDPQTPIYPTKPKKRLMIILAGFLGIGLGMGLAFIKEYTKNSDEEEQEKMSQIKSLFVQNILSFPAVIFRKK